MPDIGDAYVISVEHAGRTVSALIGPRQVEDWLAHHGAPHVVPGTLRALLHELVREVMSGQSADWPLSPSRAPSVFSGWRSGIAGWR